ncbi:MAG: hypothetical protein DIJKHBIC_04576 [Thermoanaerobaculia bacterium]|nr:hypothetical protein [Thermoanaerobaculia bacterium]
MLKPRELERGQWGIQEASEPEGMARWLLFRVLDRRIGRPWRVKMNIAVPSRTASPPVSRLLLAIVLAAFLAPSNARAGDLVRVVRAKLSAGDLLSGEAAVEEYKKKTGVDPEYLDAVGWLARGAEMLGRSEKAARYATELRQAIPEEKPDLLIPYGAAIEVEARLKRAADGRGAALRLLEGELLKARDTALRSRIQKNINLISLEGEMAPQLGNGDDPGSPAPNLTSLRGQPVLLFFWAQWCGDCKAEAAPLARILRKYEAGGLTLIAPTRLYGSGADGKPATPREEKDQMRKVWQESYPGLEKVSTPVDTETMVRYGASATPTLVLIDRKGRVRLYTPTRMSESELSRRIDEVMAEKP